jgi:hypothetical protein
MKNALLVAAATVAAMALVPSAGATAGAASARGVAVARSHGALLVATRSGRVIQVKSQARIGSRMIGRHAVGRASRARIHGVVVARKGSTLFVASNRHLLAIRTGRHLAASGSSSGVAPGTVVTSTVAVHRNGQLDQQSQTQDGEDCSSTVQVQATVAAVGAGTITLTVNGQDITINLPGGLTLPQSLVGQTVTIGVSIAQSSDNQGDDDQGDDCQGDDNSSGSSGD